MMKKIKVKKFKGCSDQDISDAILNLSNNMLTKTNDSKLKELLISLAIESWNISLFEAQGNDYKNEIKKRIPSSFSEEYKKVLTSFMLDFIKVKQETYKDIMKGIVSHTISYKDKKLELYLKTLPVKPI